jgi:hypothetical protein
MAWSIKWVWKTFLRGYYTIVDYNVIRLKNKYCDVYNELYQPTYPLYSLYKQISCEIIAQWFYWAVKSNNSGIMIAFRIHC